MKIFWAWQSDTPGKVSRHFVRGCLEAAINDLRADLELEEPEREHLHLDHDRKGVSGSPDLADLILQKIRASEVVVADVTTVGTSKGGKPLQNPNVMIELGYALAHLGSERLIMVFNSAFGQREDLPFDLRHKAGPNFYELAEDADSEAMKQARGEFTGLLRSALRGCVQAASEELQDAVASLARSVDSGKALAHFEALVDDDWKEADRQFWESQADLVVELAGKGLFGGSSHLQRRNGLVQDNIRGRAGLLLRRARGVLAGAGSDPGGEIAAALERASLERLSRHYDSLEEKLDDSDRVGRYPPFGRPDFDKEAGLRALESKFFVLQSGVGEPTEAPGADKKPRLESGSETK